MHMYNHSSHDLAPDPLGVPKHFAEVRTKMMILNLRRENATSRDWLQRILFSLNPMSL